ncbi:MAG: hypothetical protein K2O91_05840 [Lachnospiraceae bacterium]|nr:hypothetical protein [Lachnospiraceae bacterium]
MKLYKSGEDYLEALLILQNRMGNVRSTDLARHMGFTKPSICHAVSVLRKGGYITVDVAELLMSDKGAFITGADFLIDGGATASYFYGHLKPET